MRSIAIVVTFCLIACAVVSVQALADGYERLIKSRQELLGTSRQLNQRGNENAQI